MPVLPQLWPGRLPPAFGLPLIGSCWPIPLHQRCLLHLPLVVPHLHLQTNLYSPWLVLKSYPRCHIFLASLSPEPSDKVSLGQFPRAFSKCLPESSLEFFSWHMSMPSHACRSFLLLNRSRTVPRALNLPACPVSMMALTIFPDTSCVIVGFSLVMSTVTFLRL